MNVSSHSQSHLSIRSTRPAPRTLHPTFAADIQPETAPVKKDPTPQVRWNLSRIALLGLGLVGIGGAGYRVAPPLVREVAGWFQSTESSDTLPPRSQETTSTHGVQEPSTLNTDEMGYLEVFLLSYLMTQSVTLLKKSRGPLKRKTIRPSELLAELHQRGITGKGLKAAIIDSGYRPTRRLPKERVVFYSSNNLEKPAKPYDAMGHGTAVANLIADACPEADLISIGCMPPERRYQERKLEKTFLAQGFENPDGMTLAEVRRITFQLYLDAVGQSIEKALKEGASVINISLGDGDTVKRTLEDEINKQSKILKWQKRFPTFMSLIKRSTANAQAALEKRRTYVRQLKSLLNAEQTSPYDENAPWLKPWKTALDKAYAKGVPVVMSAGNDGTNVGEKLVTGENYDIFTMSPHPALILIASANESGSVSSFTSAYHGEVQPLVAANGSGELETQTCISNDHPLLRIFIPTEALITLLTYLNPPGTSFASPDFASTFLLMKSVFPELTLESLKEITRKLANPVTFTQVHHQSIAMSVRVDHPITAQMVQELAAQITQATHGKINIVTDPSAPFATLESNAPGSANQVRQFKFLNAVFRLQGELSDAETKEYEGLIIAFLNKWQDPKTWESVQPEIEAKAKELEAKYVGAGTIAGHRIAMVEEAERLAAQAKVQTAIT